MVPNQQLYKQVVGWLSVWSFLCNNLRLWWWLWSSLRFRNGLWINKEWMFIFKFVFPYSISLKSDNLLYMVDIITQFIPPLPNKTSMIWSDEITVNLQYSGASFGKIETYDSRLSLKPRKSNQDELFHLSDWTASQEKNTCKHFLKNEIKLCLLSHDFGLVQAENSQEGLPRCVSISSMSS